MSISELVTKDYQVQVAEGEKGILVYQVVHRETGVVEYEDYLFSRLLLTLPEMQSRLDDAWDKFNTVVSTNNVTPFPVLTNDGADDEEGSLH